MPTIETPNLPADAILQTYAQRDGCYTDCFATTVPGAVTLADFVTAFYTTWLFKLERIILKLAVSRPSTDAEAQQVAAGHIDRFAAWNVEQRADNQLIMCDFQGKTRSWFRIEQFADKTRLYFGSAIVPMDDANSIGVAFRVLLGFHKLYSRALLSAARSRLRSGA